MAARSWLRLCAEEQVHLVKWDAYSSYASEPLPPLPFLFTLCVTSSPLLSLSERSEQLLYSPKPLGDT